ncbi:MAG: hypothetical protein ACPG49_05670 [Chitinophagales bacterium]
MNANFLFFLESLNVLNSEEDQTELLEELALVANEIKANDDKIYLPSNWWEFDFVWGKLMDLYSKSNEIFPWLKSNAFQFFVYEFLQSTSSEQTNFEDFAAANTSVSGLVGLEFSEIPISKYIYNLFSLWEFYCYYYSNHPEDIDWKGKRALPNTWYSNLYLIAMYNQKYPKNAHLSDEEKLNDFCTDKIRNIRSNRGDLVEIAREIARRNYYKENTELSSQEQQLKSSFRTIFEIEKEGRKQYLSLDYENGLFELCNENGKHIGAINYLDSDEMKEKSKDDHSIASLRK